VQIPTDLLEREQFYWQLIQACLVSRSQRSWNYQKLRSYYLYGSSDGATVRFNKTQASTDLLQSFLFAAETTRFAIELSEEVPASEHEKVPTMQRAMKRLWHATNADVLYGESLKWSLVYNTMLLKPIWYDRAIHVYPVDPHQFGVLREDVINLDDQDAFVHVYQIGRSELMRKLERIAHPRRALIGKMVQASTLGRSTAEPSGVQRILIASSSPTMSGNVDVSSNFPFRYDPQVQDELVDMYELYCWTEAIEDYTIATLCDPGFFIFDRPLEEMHLKGEAPFVKLTPKPLHDYFWGESWLEPLCPLQDWRTLRMEQIKGILARQYKPPRSLTGWAGILDEKNFALNREGGLIATQNVAAKVQDHIPALPDDAFAEIQAIDAMFDEKAGLTQILRGKGESGVRAGRHADMLARLSSSRPKQQANVTEDALERLATTILQLYQNNVAVEYTVPRGDGRPPLKFTPKQFTSSYVCKVDSHSSSPIFTEDQKQDAVTLFKMRAIDRETVLEMYSPPNLEQLKLKLRGIEAAEAAAAAAKMKAEEERRTSRDGRDREEDLGGETGRSGLAH